MLTRVDVQSENPFFLEIRNAKPSDSIRLEKIEGLEPPVVNLFMGDYARDGGTYGGRRVPPRNVVLTVSLNPNYGNGETVDGLRRLLYKAFMDPFPFSDGVTLVLIDDTLPDRYVSGHVDKFEGDIFSDDTTVRISMLCPNPYIQDLDLTELTASGPAVPFQYEGTAETGFQIVAELTDGSTVVTLSLNGTKMYIEYAFLSGDQLIVDTQRGQRKIQVVRTTGMVTTTTNILYALDPASVWLELHSVENDLEVYGEEDTDLIANITDISFRALHWGV